MKWMRFRAGGVEGFGVLAGDKVQAWQGDMFGEKQASGEATPADLARLAEIEQPLQAATKAFDDFQQVLARYPNTRRFNEIVGEQYRIAAALLDGAKRDSSDRE